MGMMLNESIRVSGQFAATSAVALIAFGVGASGVPLPTVSVQKLTGQQIIVPLGQTWIDRQLAAIKRLELDWDGYDAEPIQQKTIGQIEALLKHAGLSSKRAGSIVPGADGSLQAEWHMTSVSFGLLVEADGRVSTWATFAGLADEIEEVGLPGALDFLKALATQNLNV